MDLIEEILSDLKPVRRSPSFVKLGVIWLAFSLLFLGIAFLIRQPLKPHTPVVLALHFCFSFCAGLLAIVSSSPHQLLVSQRFKFLAFIWPLPVLITIAIIPTPLAWFFTLRCILASLAWTIPGMLMMLWLLRTGFILRPLHSIVLGSIAAASLGSLAQNIACVELGGLHRLISHTVPVMILAAGIMASYRSLTGYLKT